MWACAIRIELRLPNARSLKAKRSIVRPHIERLRRLASLSVAEVGHHDAWQLATIGVAIVAPDSAHLDNLINRVRRYVEEQVDVEMLVFAVSYPEEL